jgi:hypothetical protein
MSGSSGSSTVPGVSGSTLSLSFVGSANVGLAQQIADALAAASSASTLDVVSYTGGPIPAAPSGTTVEELVLSSTVSGSITVPAAQAGVDAVLVVANTQAITIHGSANLSIVGGGPGALTIDDPNLVVIGASIGPTGTVSMTFSAADSPYQVAMGQGFETVNSQGSGTITGGTGPDVVNVSGPNNVIEAGSDGTTVNATGFAASIDGTAGNLVVNDAGYLDTITGGATTSAAVTTSGFRGLVIGGTGSGGSVTALDNGFHNTIEGGSGSTAVTLQGFFGEAAGGGAGLMSVLDEGFQSSIFAAAGDLSVTTASANAEVLGGTGLMSVNAAGSTGDFVAFGSGGGVFSSSASSSGAIVFAGAGAAVSVNAANTTNDTIVGGSGAITINAGSASGLLVYGPLSGLGMDFIGGSNPVTVVGQAGHDTINAGTGPLTAYLTPNETLAAGSAGGNPTIFGNSNVDVTYTGTAGSFVFIANVGNETLNASGSSTNNTYFAGVDSTGTNMITGGSGNDFFVAGAGADTFTGGTGQDAFVFASANLAGTAMTDVITNFLTGNSNVLLNGVTTVSASTSGSGSGASTTLTLSDNTKIEFLGVSSVSELHGRIFSS